MMYEEMHGTPERPADATRKFREVTAELKEIPKDVDGVWEPCAAICARSPAT